MYINYFIISVNYIIIVSGGKKEPFIESLNVYKNCKKIIREKRENIETFSKNKVDDVKFKVRRFIRQSGL